MVGVGLRPGTPMRSIVRAVQEIMGDRRIRLIATVDRRAVELGFQQAADELQVPIVAFTPDELAAVEVPNPAERTAIALATPSVAEAAALLACESVCGGGHLVITKTVIEGVTIAAATRDC
nr:cobalamin biosynthesis protein [Nocardia alni]